MSLSRGPHEHVEDVRRYRRQSERRLFNLIIVFLLVVGLGLIGLIYGTQAMVTALPCLLAGVGALLLLYVILLLLERWVGED